LKLAITYDSYFAGTVIGNPVGKLAINLMNGSTPMGIKLKNKCYINDRLPGRGSIPDTSRLKNRQILIHKSPSMSKESGF